VTSLEAALRQISENLDEASVAFALVGGLAVSARTEPRFTRDADLVVAVHTDSEAEALVLRLGNTGYAIESTVEHNATGRLATVRLRHEGRPRTPVVDLLFASSGIEEEIVADAEPLTLLRGLKIAVARVGHLIALKVLSRDDVKRPQDLVDLRALLRVASAHELVSARQALTLIEGRGYHRGKDLMGELEALLSSHRS
jgi:hypothetical protein